MQVTILGYAGWQTKDGKASWKEESGGQPGEEGEGEMTSEAPLATRWITAEQFTSDRGFECGYYLLDGKAVQDMGNAHSEHEVFKAVIQAILLRLLDRLGINGRVRSDPSYKFDNLTVMAPDVSVQIPARPFARGAYFSNSPVTPRVVALVVKKAADRVGLDATKRSGHSLRSGLATTAARNGASERSIMKQTGHRCVAMVRRYIHDAELFNDNAGAKLGL
jgi:hypothetical protein